jgi:hypothetical protein
LIANSKSERVAARQKAWIEKCKNAINVNFATKYTPIVPKVKVGSWKQMLPNNLPIGSLSSQVDGAWGFQ